MNNRTNVIFILDKSGSMYGLESDTIGGFNSMLDKQKEENGNVYITTVLFNDKMFYLHKNEPIDSVNKLTKDDYWADGCTALLDAIGNTISRADSYNNCLQDFRRADKTIVIIITDGYENSSKEFTLSQIKQLIEQKQERDNWDFIFLGANIDTINTAQSIGINSRHAASFHNDSRGIQTNFKAISNVISNELRGIEINENWSADIDEDYKNR